MQNSGSRIGLCLVTLDSLVEELLKDRPDEKRVKEWMIRVGLDYSLDPSQRMSTILEALHERPRRKSRRSDERSL